MSVEPRALIVTVGRARGALTAVRELGRAGWDVGVGTPSGGGMVTASRWCRHRHVVARPRGNDEAFLASVLDAVESQRYDLVFGGSDDYMAALATHRDQIPTIVAHPPTATVLRALDKFELAQLSMSVGLDAPTTVLATPDEVAEWSGEVIVKCRSHWSPEQRNIVRIEARRFADVSAAADRLRLIRDAGFEAILQRPIDGSLGAVAGVMRDGRLEGRVQQQALRLWPTPTGASCRARTEQLDPDLVARCERLLNELGWDGLVEIQFLTDSTGRRHVIDLNGRHYGSMSLAVAAGANLPLAWARQSIGAPDEPVGDARPGVRYSWIAGDVRRAMVERRGSMIGDLMSTVWWALRSANCVWDLRDLGPIRQLAASRLRDTGPVADSDVDS